MTRNLCLAAAVLCLTRMDAGAWGEKTFKIQDPAGSSRLVAFEAEGGRWGIRDAAKNVLIEPRYDKVDFYVTPQLEGVVVFVRDPKAEPGLSLESGGYRGLVGRDGREVVAPRYRRIERAGPYLIVRTDADGAGGAGLLDFSTGRELLACVYPPQDFMFRTAEEAGSTMRAWLDAGAKGKLVLYDVNTDKDVITVDGKEGVKIHDLSKIRLGPGATDFVLVDGRGEVKVSGLRNAIYSEVAHDWVITRKNGATELLKAGAIPELDAVAEFFAKDFQKVVVPYLAKNGKWGFLKIFPEKNYTGIPEDGSKPYDPENHRVAGPALFDSVSGAARFGGLYAVSQGDRNGQLYGYKVGVMRNAAEERLRAADADRAIEAQAEYTRRALAERYNASSFVQGGRLAVERAGGINMPSAASKGTAGANTTLSGEAMSKEAVRSREQQESDAFKRNLGKGLPSN